MAGLTDRVPISSGAAHPHGSAVALADLTTMGVGGPARRMLEVASTTALVAAVRDADADGEPVLLLGGGSNVVVSDDGFPGLVVLIRSTGITRRGATVTAAAGEPWDELVSYAVSHQLAGIECLAGIPGLVGATPIQNVGAYGQEVSDVIQRVTAYDRHDGAVRDLTPAECGFGYRTSRFKAQPGRWVVTEVEFGLRESAQSGPLRYGELSRALQLTSPATAPLDTVREAVLQLRRKKGMVLDPTDPDTASCGSFFTNPVLDAPAYDALSDRVATDVPRFAEPDGRFKVPAAWLIERAGFAKGFGAELGRGRARLSSKHPLAITNRGGATAAEILTLAREVRNGVRDRLGVVLVNEPVLIGEQL
jgi:UDP-N-acetylmuramate dehydrogenase